MNKNIESYLEKNNITRINDFIINFFWDDLDFLGFLGSKSNWNFSDYSDIDYIILLNTDVDQPNMEKLSPILKEKISKLWIDELCAFNIYQTKDFINSPNWFKLILTKNLKSVKNNLNDDIDTICQSLPFKQITWEEKTWSINTKDTLNDIINRIEFVSNKLQLIIKSIEDKNIKRYYELEYNRLKMLIQVINNWFFSTVIWFEDIAKRLWVIDWIIGREEDFEYQILSESIFYWYNFIEKNYELSKNLEWIDEVYKLKHLLISCHSIMRKILHNKWYFIIDGEVSQMFYKNTSWLSEVSLKREDFYSLIKAEQIVWRSWIISFDLKSWKPLYAESDEYISRIIEELDIIYNKLQNNYPKQIESKKDINVSIVIPSYNRFDQVKESILFLNNLIYPEDKLEIVIVDDWSSDDYDITQLNSKFPIKLIKKEHSWITDTRNIWISQSKWSYIMFLDDDIKVTPLSLLRLLYKSNEPNMWITWLHVKWFPEKWIIPEYSHYRWLLSWPILNKNWEILNIPSCCVLMRRKILEILWDFSVEQWKNGITFWWEDVDITFRARNAWYRLYYNWKGNVYHKHRDSISTLVKQHFWYWRWTAFHCIERDRNFSELWIPSPNFYSVSTDVLNYIYSEIPKRMINLIKEKQSFIRVISYTILDITRKVSYNLWVLSVRKLYNKWINNEK